MIQDKTSLSKNYVLLAALSVAILTFAVYLPSLNNDFVNWDDQEYVYENQNIRSVDGGFFRWVTTAVVAALWHPLTMLSFAIDHAIWGINPLGYHLTNVVFHTANTFLVFILAIRLIQFPTLSKPNSLIPILNKKGAGGGRYSLIAAAVTALLFGLHPIHVESVAWVSERKDVLCAFFFLLSLLAYVNYASTEGFNKVCSYALCIIFFILALMSKPMAVSLPLILIILDYFPFNRLSMEGRFRQVKTVLLEKTPFLVLSLIISVITIWAQHSDEALMTTETYPLMGRIFAAAHGYIFYLVKMVLPFNLAPFYPYPKKVDSFTLKYIGAFVILLILTFLVHRSLKKYKIFFAGWGYYLLTLFPVIGILQVGGQAAADRYTYLPSLGPFLFIGVIISIFFEKLQKRQHQFILITTLVLLSILLAVKTKAQISVWHDSIRLWSHEIKIYPHFNLAYTNRGEAYSRLQKYTEALYDFNEAIKLDFTDFKAYLNRGNIYKKMDNLSLALSDFNRAIEINPRYGIAYTQRGSIHLYLGNLEQAQNDFNTALKLNPDDAASVYFSRAFTYHNLGKYDEAINDYKRANELDPGNAKIYDNLGMVYMEIGNETEALFYFKKAARLGVKEAQDYLDEQNIKWR